MAEATVPVDLFNPGQVFACLGLVEAAAILLGDAEGAFDWSHKTRCSFALRASGDQSPVEAVLSFLALAQARGEAPEGSQCHANWNKSWGKLDARARELGYPNPEPPSPATVVCMLDDGKQTIAIDHWGDETRRDNVKFWAGAGGYPGVALARDALELIRADVANSVADPFALARPQSSSFRLDWRRDYIPLDTGFSLNAHDAMAPVGYPIVELLAAIGLTHARPLKPNERNKLEYTYAAIGRVPSARHFPRSLLRSALGGAALPFPMRHFRMALSWPGKEGQARAITAVTEEKK